jgi:hypothetical protein
MKLPDEKALRRHFNNMYTGLCNSFSRSGELSKDEYLDGLEGYVLQAVQDYSGSSTNADRPTVIRSLGTDLEAVNRLFTSRAVPDAYLVALLGRGNDLATVTEQISSMPIEDKSALRRLGEDELYWIAKSGSEYIQEFASLSELDASIVHAVLQTQHHPLRFVQRFSESEKSFLSRFDVTDLARGFTVDSLKILYGIEEALDGEELQTENAVSYFQRTSRDKVKLPRIDPTQDWVQEAVTYGVLGPTLEQLTALQKFKRQSREGQNSFAKKFVKLAAYAPRTVHRERRQYGEKKTPFIDYRFIGSNIISGAFNEGQMDAVQEISGFGYITEDHEEKLTLVPIGVKDHANATSLENLEEVTRHYLRTIKENPKLNRQQFATSVRGALSQGVFKHDLEEFFERTLEMLEYIK